MTGANGVPPRRYRFGNGVADVVRDVDLTRIVLTGDLDMSTVPRIRLIVERECERRPERVVIDVSAVEFVDSHGLQLLADTHRRLTVEGASLVVVPPADPVRRAFELTSLEWLFGDYPTEYDVRLASDAPDR